MLVFSGDPVGISDLLQHLPIHRIEEPSWDTFAYDMAIEVEQVDSARSLLPQRHGRRPHHLDRRTSPFGAGVVSYVKIRDTADNTASGALSQFREGGQICRHIQVTAGSGGHQVQQLLSDPGSYIESYGLTLADAGRHPGQELDGPPFSGFQCSQAPSKPPQEVGHVGHPGCFAPALEVVGMAQKVQLKTVHSVSGAGFFYDCQPAAANLLPGVVQAETVFLARAAFIVRGDVGADPELRVGILPVSNAGLAPIPELARGESIGPVLVDVVHPHAQPELHVQFVRSLGQQF